MNMLAFNQDVTEFPESEDLKALNDFLARPNSIGLDNLKEIFRNMIQLMMELKGYSTGYAVHHLANGEHSSLALSGVLKGDEEKRRRQEELERLMRQLEDSLMQEFDRLFTHVENRINAITLNVEQKIAILDEQIADDIADDESEIVVETKKKKRKMLKAFMSKVQERKKELAEVETPEEIIEVEADLVQDIEALENRTIDQPQTPRRNPFESVATIIRERREAMPPVTPIEPEEDHDEPETIVIGGQRVVKRPKSKRKSGGSGKTDDTSGSSTGDEGSEGSGSGEKTEDEDIAPPQNLDL